MKQAPDPTLTSQRETLPMQVDVKIHSLHASGPVLADASVNLNGCFAIRGVKVVEGSNGPFVSMPSYKGRDGYKDICFPCTKEFHQQFHQAVLDAYQQTLAQIPQRQQEGQQGAERGEMFHQRFLLMDVLSIRRRRGRKSLSGAAGIGTNP